MMKEPARFPKADAPSLILLRRLFHDFPVEKLGRKAPWPAPICTLPRLGEFFAGSGARDRCRNESPP